MTHTYDVTVIGSGPGGYIAAIRCAQLGMKTAIVERYATLGGTCLNVGCIPSKALLDSSEHFHNLSHVFAAHGINASGVTCDFVKMVQRKNEVVSSTADGIAYLMNKNKITVHHGHGAFVKPGLIAVQTADGGTIEIATKNTIIATGSKPASLPGIAIDKQRVISSTEALSLPTVPKKIVVIGGGIIGLELGSVYARLGTTVQVVEFMDSLIATMDRSLGKELQRVLKKLGIEFFLKHTVQSVETSKSGVTVLAESPKGDPVSFDGEYCLMAVGRKPYTDGLNLAAVGVQLDARGRIQVDAHLQTTAPNIFAIGDVVTGAMLAHKAEEEGVLVAEQLAGQKPHLNYRLIPGVVYTWPEVAAVGFTEEELKTDNRAYKSGSFPFKALGRARAAAETDGFVKVLADQTTDEILGVHIIGPRAADMIGEAVVAMEYRASAEDIARMSHAHPTFSEAFKEACLAATANRALNM